MVRFTFFACLVAACTAAAAAPDFDGILPPSSGTAVVTPALPAPSPTPSGPVAFAGKWGKLYFRLLPVEAAGLIGEKSMAEGRARRGVRFVTLQVVNESPNDYRWIDGHDTAIITLSDGRSLTSEDPTLLMESSTYPWGYAHVGELVHSRADAVAGGAVMKFLAFRGAFDYGDIASARLRLGVHTVTMRKVPIRKSTPRGRLPGKG